MDPLIHTIIALAVVWGAWYIGHRMGASEGYGAGFEIGASNAIDGIMTALKQQYGLDISYEVEIEDSDAYEE